jgi:mono/diheme cytochrome c family protein
MRRAVLLAAALAGSPAQGAQDFPAKDTPAAMVYRGGIVFQHYCALCHGSKADGNGRAARLYEPRPANLVRSDKNDAYKELIVRQGGKALGRSEFMPPWGNELTNEQVADVVAYLHSIAATPVNQ